MRLPRVVSYLASASITVGAVAYAQTLPVRQDILPDIGKNYVCEFPLRDSEGGFDAVLDVSRLSEGLTYAKITKKGAKDDSPRISFMINGPVFGDDEGDSFYDKNGSRKWDPTKKELNLSDSDRVIFNTVTDRMASCKK